ncbi:DUF4132 domain-containing protein [Dactylosporangium sp. NPDC049525]|uniref:DUF4132 domain-containing protein n=1 Tax=Dactylosporangium sp. NPDC049525 TaxID=3154730 RepID=UPI003419526A
MGTNATLDEDTLVIPAGWRDWTFPRRGEVTGFVPQPTAVIETSDLIDLHRDGIQAELEREGVPADLAAAGRAWLAGDPGRTPLGAAVVAAVLLARLTWRDMGRGPSITDGWIIEHGLDFAARACLELAGLHAGRFYGGHVMLLRRRAHADVPDVWADTAASRIRHAIAAAPDEEYAAIVATLQEYRAGVVNQRIAATFLDPTRPGWVEEDIAALATVSWNEGVGHTLLTCVTTAAQVDALTAVMTSFGVFRSNAVVCTLVLGAGGAALGPLLAWLDHEHIDPDSRKFVLSGIAGLPSDAAFEALLDRIDKKQVAAAVIGAAARFPTRAMRLLALHGSRRAVADLLRSHVARHRKLAESVLPALPPDAAHRIVAVIDAIDAVREAPADALPPILVSPPWTGARKTAKPIVIDGLTCTDGRSAAWAPGERDAWRGGTTQLSRFWRPGLDAEHISAQLRLGPVAPVTAVKFFLRAEEPVAAPLLAEWRVKDTSDAAEWLPLIVGRFGAAAYPVVLAVARAEPAAAARAMLPVAGPELAELAADWFSRVKTLRPHARAWLTRHPAAATRALIPAALGEAGPARQAAGLALAVIGRAGHRDTAIAAAADAYGPQVADVVAGLLDADPLMGLPSRMPSLPDWADPAVLPPVQLRADAGTLPSTAARHLLLMLAISKPDEPYAGVDVVRDACEPASLAEFGRALFQHWLNADAPSKCNWAYETTLSLTGDDETVRRLSPLIRTWPSQLMLARAVTGVEILARIGSDLALMHLHSIASKVKNRGVRERATLRLASTAADRGLTPEQLADRLVPDLGLDPSGSLTLDYGSRRFVVGFDEQLTPYVADEGGARRKALPKPGAKDDPVLAPAAFQRFAGLKKDARTIAAEQIHRLERAMVNQRRWTPEELQDLFLNHPLVWHVARRLVWADYGPDGSVRTAFRLAEDRSLADIDDTPAILDPAALVGVAHPLDLGPVLARWSEILADYEILQPFPQLGRETFALTPAEQTATALTRFADLKGPTGRFVGLARRGWQLGPPLDGGAQCWVERDVPGGHRVIAYLSPGILIGNPGLDAEQILGTVHLAEPDTDPYRGEPTVPLGVLDPLTASEVLRDLLLTTA